MDKISRSLFYPSILEGQVIVSVREVVEGVLPPMFLVEENLWDFRDRQVDSYATAATALMVLNPTVAAVPDAIPEEYRDILHLDSLAPLKLVAPLLKPPFLSPPAACDPIKARVDPLNFTAALHPLLAWIQGIPKYAVPGVSILGALDLEDHITGGRRRLWRQHWLLQKKEVTPANRWELQHISLSVGCATSTD